MKKIWDWFVKKISFFIALALIIVILRFIPGVLDRALEKNEEFIAWLFGKFSLGWMSYLGGSWIAKWVLLFIEVPFFAVLTSLFLLVLANSAFGWAHESRLSEVLRIMVLWFSAACNIAMALYVYSILWGDVKIWGHVLVVAYDPKTMDFFEGIRPGAIAALYTGSQFVPFLFRPSAGIVWLLASILTSMPTFVIVMWTALVYLMGDYAWSTYRLGVLSIWIPMVLMDVVSMANAAWLNKRAIAGFSNSTEETRHDHH